MTHVAIIGAGIFGTMHSYFALKKGYTVTLIERDPKPLSASVRNFGMVAVGGRAPGEELAAAVRARQLWGEIAADVPNLTFRPSGSIVVALNDNHLSVMSEVAKYPDASERGWKLLDSNEAREINPGLRGKIAGGLFCSMDAVVEPNLVLDELRDWLNQQPFFKYLPAQEVVGLVEYGKEVRINLKNGVVLAADQAIVVPGAEHSTLYKDELHAAPLRRVFLQMARLEDPGFAVTTSIASFDSLRFYPGYQGEALEKLEPVRPLVKEMVMQLLLQQRIDGTLTMGDTHIYDEPFPHEMREDCYDLLLDDVEAILGRRPRILTRWQGIYSQNTTGEVCIRLRPSERIRVVTGPGGRGNTLSPAIAETTMKELQSD
jgi:FAD dependent oxidoreductase TIGR03364